MTEAHKAAVELVLRALVADEGHTTRDVVHDDVVWWVPASAAAQFGLAWLLQGWDDIPWFGVRVGGLRGGFGARSRSTTWSRRATSSPRGLPPLIPRAGSAVIKYGTRIKTSWFRFVDDRIAEVWEVADTAGGVRPCRGAGGSVRLDR